MNAFGMTDDQLALMKKHLELVIEINKRMNLTRIDTLSSGWLLHVEDSLTALEEVNAAIPGRYADLGSGAGFPGIPLAIATGRKTDLVEVREKKANALREIVRSLELEDSVSVECERIETLALQRAGAYSVVTARALAKLSVLMELASPLLKKGGSLVCYKANIDDDEMKHALSLQKQLGMELAGDRSFYLSDDETHRRIVTFVKTGRPRIKLPRQVGYAQKKPL